MVHRFPFTMVTVIENVNYHPPHPTPSFLDTHTNSSTPLPHQRTATQQRHPETPIKSPSSSDATSPFAASPASMSSVTCSGSSIGVPGSKHGGTNWSTRVTSSKSLLFQKAGQRDNRLADSWVHTDEQTDKREARRLRPERL